MAKILVTYDMFREGFKELEEKYEVTFPEGRDFTYEEVYEMLPEYDVLCSMFDFPVNKELIDHAPNLQLVSNYAVGYNNIDVAYCLEKGVTVTNTPGPVTAPTANIALGLLLDTARRITECDRRLRVEKESMWGVMKNLGFTLEGRTLGIIGMGNIGKTVAEMAKVFRMHVIYHNQHSTVEGYEKVDLDTLLRRSDYISLHTPLTESTRHLIGKRELELMKPTAILINTPGTAAALCTTFDGHPMALRGEAQKALLTALIAKLFNDRQIIIGQDILEYILNHTERSFDFVTRLIAEIDDISWTYGRAVTIPIVKEAFNAISKNQQLELFI